MKAAVGTRGEPGPWERAGEGVALHGRFRDGAWSFLFKGDTRYAAGAPADSAIPEAGPVHGPMMKAPVWTWEVPLYFWLGGIAAGSSFVALACDVAGDHRSARAARMVALGSLAPSPALLVMDLGRPGRFYNMLRIFKPRSPMSAGAWALTLFGGLGSGSVAADVLGRPRLARRLGAGTAVVGTYLGSYTGVLLASTAVPLWARSRLFLGPIFVATATATGAAACRLVLAPSRAHVALERVEAGAVTAELALSHVNERRLGALAEPLTASPVFIAAKWLARLGLAMRLAGRGGRVASVLFLIAGLCFRFAWVSAGKRSARNDEGVAQTARSASGRPQSSSDIDGGGTL